MRERKDHFFGTSRAPRYVHELDLVAVVPNPEQPRKHFDEEKLRELAASIERHGLLQPIVVQKVPGGEQFLVVAGERRFRAHQLLGRETIDAIIFDGMPDTEELALIENLQRENLHPLEEAEALARLAERHGYSQETLAEAIGKSRPTVNEILRLNELPDPIKEECRTVEAPRVLLLQLVKVEDEAARAALWEEIKSGRITSVRQAKERRQSRRHADRSRPSEVDQAISFGRSFARRIQNIPDEYLSANQAEYAALMQLAREIAERMDAARNRIGEPIAPETTTE